MGISGINCSQSILSSMAKNRVEQGIITTARIIKDKDRYKIHFTNPEAKWNEQDLILCSTRDPTEPKTFRSFDDALAELKRIRLMKSSVVIDYEI